MTSAKHVLLAVVLAALGIWGCAQSAPSGATGSADRIRALETKVAKWEADFKAISAERDQLRRKLAAADEQLAKVRGECDEQLQVVSRERDELKNQLTLRTAERDTLVTQFDQFRKNIKELLGQAEASLAHPAEPPVTSAVEVQGPGKM